MSTEDEATQIYGLEFQARSLAAQTADTETSKFIVGTQTLKTEENQIHVVEISEGATTLTSQVFPHTKGELWHLHWSTHDPQLISSTYSCPTDDGGTVEKTHLWRIPNNGTQLESVAEIGADEEVKVCFFHPSDPRKVVTVSESKFIVWDIGAAAPTEVYSKGAGGKGSHKLYTGKWNPQESGAALATIQEHSMKGWDLRSDSEAWCIDSAHIPRVRDLDYNRNKQQTLCSAGDDGLVKVWDLRSLNAGLTLTGHTHWVWTCRYNPLHDELILSSGSDASGRLWWAGSVASEPSVPASNRKDGPLRHYAGMEDSVYVSEWSGADPWIFAMLSYDGRLLIHRVPKAIKYDILDI